MTEKTNMSLMDAKVRSLKAKSAPYKISDSEGLYLLVPVSGAKLWRLAYRFNGKQKSFALGKYPAISLLAARRFRDDAKRLLLSGIDPSADRKAERRKKSIAIANTFEAVANEWFQVNKGRWVDTYSLRLRSRLPRCPFSEAAGWPPRGGLPAGRRLLRDIWAPPSAYLRKTERFKTFVRKARLVEFCVLYGHLER